MNKQSKLPIKYVKSVGPRRADIFEQIGIKTVRDLFFYFPTKYIDRSNILTVTEILKLVTKGYDGEVTIIGSVNHREILRYGKKKILKVLLVSQGEYFETVWFQGIKYFDRYFNEGEQYAISGKPVLTRYGHLQFSHPDFDLLNEKDNNAFINTGKIIPFYRLPKKLKSANIGIIGLRKIIKNALNSFLDKIEETLPAYFIKENKLLPIQIALKNIHSPENSEILEKALNRFKFEELFYFELLVAIRKNKVKLKTAGITFQIHSEPIKKFLISLPFKLTRAQLKVLHEIRLDMENPQPMNRLLQGDVGSGKTIVAAITAIIAITNGYQAVLMAPTEILADQHYKTLKKLFKILNIRPTPLIGGQKKAHRAEILNSIESGETQLIVGTHALFEEKVKFKNLGLVIIDEQHRFGVLQRLKLINKGVRPDVLIMTATPIPRTLTMSIYGDLDVSVIDELPPGRKPAKTILRGESRLPEIFEFIKKKVSEGEQAFIVYPLIEESDSLNLKAAENHFKNFKEKEFKNFKVALIHGKMNWQEKELIMQKFASGEFDILISTTVIEVGIDVPNANIIVINDAFRFGLSQLHQLRGRVGRGNKQAYCILITKDEHLKNFSNKMLDIEYMSSKEKEKYRSFIRLKAMVDYYDGFKLAEIDLQLRGPGNIYGSEQSGFPSLKYANIIEDKQILIKAKKAAFTLLEKDPDLRNPSNAIINQILKRDYFEHLKFAEIG